MLYSNIVLKTKNERVFDRMEKYREQLDDLKKEIKELEGRSTTYSGVRFVSFIVAVAGLIIGIYDSRSVFIAIGIVLAVAFIAMVFVHGSVMTGRSFVRTEANIWVRMILLLRIWIFSDKTHCFSSYVRPEQRKDDAALQRVSKILDMILR